MSGLQQRRILALRYSQTPLEVTSGRRRRRVRDSTAGGAQEMAEAVLRVGHREQRVLVQVEAEGAHVGGAQRQVGHALAQVGVLLHRERVGGLVEEAVLERVLLRDGRRGPFLGEKWLDALVAGDRGRSVLVLDGYCSGVVLSPGTDRGLVVYLHRSAESF